MERAATLSAEVAEEIRAVLGRRRMSQAGLARALGRKPMWVSDRLRGEQEIGLDDLRSIADALGMRIVELLPESERRLNTRSVPSAHPVSAAPHKRTRRPPTRHDATRPGRRNDISRPRRVTPPIAA